MVIKSLFLCILFAGTLIAEVGGGSDGTGDPHSVQRVELIDGAVIFRISGTLQENDSQYVHDVVCEDTGSKIGTVRMRWAHKYGHRYGGVGVATEGNVECVWQGDMGWVKVMVKHGCQRISIVPRVSKITD
jgi:hypothetical protein